MNEPGYRWNPMAMMSIARRNEHGQFEACEPHIIPIQGYRALAVQVHPQHCARKFCIVGSVICLN